MGRCMRRAIWNWVKSVWAWASSRETIFTTVCWIAAAYFAYASLQPFFPPPNLTENARYVPLLFAIFFLVAPFASKIEIAKVLTFESRLKEVKKEQEKQEQEIRHLQTLNANLANSVTTLSAVSSSAQVNNYFNPPVTSAEAQQDLIEAENTDFAKVFEDALNAPEDMPNHVSKWAVPQPPSEDELKGNLLLMSSNLQGKIRSIIGREIREFDKRPIKYMSARQLYGYLLKRYPELLPLEKSFELFFSTANAASHGQLVSIDNLADALVFGGMLVTEIDKFSKELPATS